MKPKTWIEENKHLFKDLRKGKIYIVYKGEPPVLRGKKKAPLISEKGNKQITKISICSRCGKLRESLHLRKTDCHGCLWNITKDPFKKKKIVKKIEIDDAAYEGLKKGFVYNLFENNETIPEDSMKLDLKNKVSPVTGAKYKGKICLCRVCGGKRYKKERMKPICGKCTRVESYGKRNAKTAHDIAFKITGPYQKVIRPQYTPDPDIFDELWSERWVA